MMAETSLPPIPQRRQSSHSSLVRSSVSTSGLCLSLSMFVSGMVTPPFGPVREVRCPNRGTVLPVLVIGFLDRGIPEQVSCRLFLQAEMAICQIPGVHRFP